jgi:hypothetical protein
MEDFMATVHDERLGNRLWRAIQGRGAFRRFKDVLLNYPDAREDWFAFKDQLMEERVVEWLRSIGVVAAGREAEPDPD